MNRATKNVPALKLTLVDGQPGAGGFARHSVVHRGLFVGWVTAEDWDGIEVTHVASIRVTKNGGATYLREQVGEFATQEEAVAAVIEAERREQTEWRRHYTTA